MKPRLLIGVGHAYGSRPHRNLPLLSAFGFNPPDSPCPHIPTTNPFYSALPPSPPTPNLHNGLEQHKETPPPLKRRGCCTEGVSRWGNC